MRAPAGDQFRRTAATAGVQQAPGALKYQRAGGILQGLYNAPKAVSGGNSALLRRQPPPTNGAVDFWHEFQTITTFVVAAFQ